MDRTISFDPKSISSVMAALHALSAIRVQLELEKLVTQYDDLSAALDAEGADVTAILTELAGDVAGIQTLQNQLAAALANAARDLTPLIQKVKDQTASMAAQPTTTAGPNG